MPNKVERIKTNYPSVYYIMAKAADGPSGKQSGIHGFSALIA
jgi:hypothetical protein